MREKPEKLRKPNHSWTEKTGYRTTCQLPNLTGLSRNSSPEADAIDCRLVWHVHRVLLTFDGLRLMWLVIHNLSSFFARQLCSAEFATVCSLPTEKRVYEKLLSLYDIFGDTDDIYFYSILRSSHHILNPFVKDRSKPKYNLRQRTTENWFRNLLAWAIGNFLLECDIKILTDTCIDNHTDNRISPLYFMLFMILFSIFALLIVLDAYDIWLINENGIGYVCVYVCM